MFEAILAILSSSGLGAITGGFFGLLNKKEERLNKREDNDHEYRMGTLALEETRMNNGHQLQLAVKEMDKIKVEGEQRVGEIEADSFKESVKSAFIKIGIPVVDAIRFLIRPVITVYLLAIASYLAFSIGSLVGGLETIPLDELMYLYRYVIAQTFFLATTATTWWFSSRKHGHDIKL